VPKNGRKYLPDAVSHPGDIFCEDGEGLIVTKKLINIA
jgi:hypothetical protein